jgi:hypothetical protein
MMRFPRLPAMGHVAEGLIGHGRLNGRMDEPQVRERIAKWMSRKRRGESWRLIGYKEAKRHGPDLVFERHGHEFVIEVKGDPGKGNHHPSSGREVSFISALGELVTRMDREQASRYGVAFPESYREKALGRIPWKAAKLLRLTVFIVGEGGRVEEYTTRTLKALQQGTGGAVESIESGLVPIERAQARRRNRRGASPQSTR